MGNRSSALGLRRFTRDRRRGCAASLRLGRAGGADPHATARSAGVPGLPRRPLRAVVGERARLRLRRPPLRRDEPARPAGDRRRHRRPLRPLPRCPSRARRGATTDGLNLASVSSAERNVTCFFCHSVDAVGGTNDDPLHLASDGALRGGIANPVSTPAHASAYSPLHDRTVATSAPLCGACHDVEMASGLAVEQTFAEWRGSVYAQESTLATCGKCHLAGSQGLAANVPGAPVRTVHDHSAPGVDVVAGAAGATGDAGGGSSAVQALPRSGGVCTALRSGLRGGNGGDGHADERPCRRTRLPERRRP